MAKKIQLQLSDDDERSDRSESPITAKKVDKNIKQNQEVLPIPVLVKEKRKMSQDSLDKLALAREKALHVRKQNADLKKQIAEEEFLKKSGKQISKKVEKMQQQLNVQNESEEDEEEVKTIKKVASKKKKVVYESESDNEEEEEEIVYVKKPKSSKAINNRVLIEEDRKQRINSIQWV